LDLAGLNLSAFHKARPNYIHQVVCAGGKGSRG